MDSWVGIALLEPVPRIDIFLAAFDDVPDPRVDNARHDRCELLVGAFVAVLCGAVSCAGMADFGRAKEHVFRGFLKLRHAIPSHDTDPTVFRMIDPKALERAAFQQTQRHRNSPGTSGRIPIPIERDAPWMRPSGGCWPGSRPGQPRPGNSDVIAIDGKALRGARDKGQSAARGRQGPERADTRMMVSACATRLRLTLATVAADQGRKPETALEVPDRNAHNPRLRADHPLLVVPPNPTPAPLRYISP